MTESGNKMILQLEISRLSKFESTDISEGIVEICVVCKIQCFQIGEW